MAKHYMRHPDDYLAATRWLTPEQRGIYNDLIEFYISRDGDLADIDKHRAHELAVDRRVYKRIKSELIKAGKIEVVAGILVPNGAKQSLSRALGKSARAREAAHSRWCRRGINPLTSKEIADAGADAKAAAPVLPGGGPGGCQPELEPEPEKEPLPETAGRPSPPGGAAAIIKAFDDSRAEHFGDRRRRPWPHATDRAQAERWLAAGIANHLAWAKYANHLAWSKIAGVCRAVFDPVMRTKAENGDDPPACLKYFDAPVMRSLGPTPNIPKKRSGVRTDGQPGQSANHLAWAKEAAMWRARIKGFAAAKFWLGEWGDPPGRPGCRAPKEILREFGL